MACKWHKQVHGSTLSRRAGRKWQTRLLQTITHALTVRFCLQKHGATVVAKALCAQLPSQPGKKNKWLGKRKKKIKNAWRAGAKHCFGGQTVFGCSSHMDTRHPHQHPQHLSWVSLQLMQGSQPPSPCPALTCWGCVKSSEKTNCLTLPTFIQAREGSKGEGDKHLVE